MTKLESAVRRAQQAAQKAYRLHEQKVRAARKALGKRCTHPAEALQTYDWEHDNGYGRQTKMEGLRCTLCYAQKSYKDYGEWSYDRNYDDDDEDSLEATA